MPRTNPEARAWVTAYLRSHPSATWNEARSAAAAAGVSMSINTFYRWRQQLQGGGAAGERTTHRQPTATTGTTPPTVPTVASPDGLVATLQAELARSARMRQALDQIRRILSDMPA